MRIFTTVFLVLAGCLPVSPLPEQPADFAVYAAGKDGGHVVPAIEAGRYPPYLLRSIVSYPSAETAGTIVVDPGKFHLYFILGEGRAVRYGLAIGKEGFGWSGTGYVGRRARWPGWTPPPEMVERKPELARWSEGMPGGRSDNPLGARALYIYQNGHDTQIRFHGTIEPYSIGRRASSGCFRMFNQDVIDLYERVADGAKVVVLAERPVTIAAPTEG